MATSQLFGQWHCHIHAEPAVLAFICCTYRVLLVGFSFHFQVHTDRISFLTLCHEGPSSTVQLLVSSSLDGHGAAEKKTVRSSGLREVLCPNVRCWIGWQHFCCSRGSADQWGRVKAQSRGGGWMGRELWFSPTWKSTFQTSQHQKLKY